MRNLKALFYRLRDGQTYHGYKVLISTEVLVNADNSIDALEQVSDIRELLADVVRRNGYTGREVEVRAKSL